MVDTLLLMPSSSPKDEQTIDTSTDCFCVNYGRLLFQLELLRLPGVCCPATDDYGTTISHRSPGLVLSALSRARPQVQVS